VKESNPTECVICVSGFVLSKDGSCQLPPTSSVTIVYNATASRISTSNIVTAGPRISRRRSIQEVAESSADSQVIEEEALKDVRGTMSVNVFFYCLFQSRFLSLTLTTMANFSCFHLPYPLSPNFHKYRTFVIYVSFALCSHSKNFDPLNYLALIFFFRHFFGFFLSQFSF
jgi:hypothetical protein